jgi:hypothetical protein
MRHVSSTIATFVIFSIAPSLLVGCTAAETEEAAVGSATEEAIRNGQCTLAPRSYEILRNPALASQIPPFSAVAWSADSNARTVGPWNRESSAVFGSPYDPNRWTSSGHWAIQSPAAGSYVQWSLPIPASDRGTEFAVYAFIPGAARATKALYRIYDGKSDTATNTIEINQERAKNGAEAVTLAGKNYSAPGWVLLGQRVLYENARVSLDASASVGKLVADSVVAVRWGCRESVPFRRSR